ncbi:hypothetical protein VFPPC_08024 [Pochonia chlamydosporia 170]|uniref:Uncharacterized protein n=1 Tax=Pochonia chlamydosporia 170 TaxID=1380566 RepID=A0A179FLP1_METCM|nr:hypothetical protein VFPPC_08024 [Pochonia chlamydosporia 170]OAQ66474.1 hypothetical protein VFPPC_08024 [Pochonia chlamydosporia 170]
MSDMGTRKTERSHEENQERAYIAASRRADRSIEARVQSARQASEIHKKRTGKGFKVSEEIVMKEEMYEEEDDDMPRSIHLLNANMQTPSADMNLRLESYLANKVAFSQALAQSNMAWRDNEINRAFAESFPNAASMSPPQHQAGSQALNMLNSAMYPQSPESYPPTTGYSPQGFSPATMAAPYSPTSCSPGPAAYSPASVSFSPSSVPFSPATMPVSMQQSSFPSSMTYQPTMNTNRRRSQTSASTQGRRRRSSNKSPPSLGGTVGTPSSGFQTQAATPNLDNTVTADTPIDSVESMAVPSGSVFTAELPPEARMILTGVGADDVLDQTLAGQDLMFGTDESAKAWGEQMPWETSSYPQAGQMESVDPELMPDLYGNGTPDSMPSKCAMPTAADDEAWATFMNDSMFAKEPQL